MAIATPVEASWRAPLSRATASSAPAPVVADERAGGIDPAVLELVRGRLRFGQLRLHGRPDKQQQERAMRSARRAPIR
jgi:hypothetical protein